MWVEITLNAEVDVGGVVRHCLNVLVNYHRTTSSMESED